MRRFLLCLVAGLGASSPRPWRWRTAGRSPSCRAAAASSVARRGTSPSTTRSRATREMLAISTSGRDRLDPARARGRGGFPYTPAGRRGCHMTVSTLVLADSQSGFASPSTFLVVSPRRMQLVRTIALRGYFSFDALSPNGSRMYLIQYTHAQARRPDRLHRPRLRHAHEPAAAGKDRRSVRARGDDGRLSRDADDERGTGVGCTRSTRSRPASSSSMRSTRSVPRRTASTFRGTAASTTSSSRFATDGRTLAAYRRSGRPWLERRRRQLAHLVPARRLPVGLGRRRDRRRLRASRRRSVTPSAPPRPGTPGACSTGARARVASGNGRNRARGAARSAPRARPAGRSRASPPGHATP